MEKQKAWDRVKKKTEESKIKRYPWKKMLNMPLTTYSQKLFQKGYVPSQVFDIALRHPGVKRYLRENPLEERKLSSNALTTISSQYCVFNKIKEMEFLGR
jgi:hypothetical protein